jgi:hypothetical protein
MATAGDDLVWLPLPEAAVRLGKSTDAVRSMLRRGKLASRKGNDGGVLVGVPPAFGDGQATVEDQSLDGRATAELRATADELKAEVLELRERLARAEGEAAKAREVAEAKIEAARAVAVADVATARAEGEAKEQVIAELRAMLAEARKPWWRRWRG